MDGDLLEEELAQDSLESKKDKSSSQQDAPGFQAAVLAEDKMCLVQLELETATLVNDRQLESLRELKVHIHRLGKAILEQGTNFIKHQTKSSPHVRFVFWSGNKLVWTEKPIKGVVRAPTSSSSAKSIELAEVIGVYDGWKTPAFQKRAPKCSADTCLSIVTLKRTLDLQFKDVPQRNLWRNSISDILKMNKIDFKSEP